MRLALRTPPGFNLWRTVYSHGWCALPPFSVDKERNVFGLAARLVTGRMVRLSLTDKSPSTLAVEIEAEGTISPREKSGIGQLIRSCLRLDEDFSEFFTEAGRHSEFRWVARKCAGRLLRAPSVFEDVVKMMCTTNCSWALTEVMVSNLCRVFGSTTPGGARTFPEAGAIADSSERFLRKEIHAGYRAPYLLEFARNAYRGRVKPESWRQSEQPTEELFEEVRSVKGIGPYAAGNLLKLLGRYDYLGIDSWCRKKFFGIHKNGRRANDRAIERYYEPFGKWRGLFFWLDITREWYDQKFPF